MQDAKDNLVFLHFQYTTKNIAGKKIKTYHYANNI